MLKKNKETIHNHDCNPHHRNHSCRKMNSIPVLPHNLER